MSNPDTRFIVKAEAIVRGEIPKEPREAQFALRLRTRGTTLEEHHIIDVMFENAGSSNKVLTAACATRRIPNWFMDLATAMIKYGIVVTELDRIGPVISWYQLERLS